MDRDERIRQRAYQLWEQDGSPDGREQDHWAQAAKEIDSEDARGEVQQAAAPNAKSRTRKLPSTGS